MYKRTGPEHLRVVGETEFVNGIAAMSASGLYGDCRIAAGIVGTAELMLGAQWARYWTRTSPRAAGASAASATGRLGRQRPGRQRAAASRARTSIATPGSAKASPNWRRAG